MSDELIRFSVEISPEANEALVREAKLNKRSRIAHASLVLEQMFNSSARPEQAEEQDERQLAVA